MRERGGEEKSFNYLYVWFKREEGEGRGEILIANMFDS
jgi:hypothetical protein